MDWRAQAACRGVTSKYWDADEPTVLTFRLCSECPVRMDCLTEAMDRHWTEDVGVWGWTTPRQRRLLRQRKLTLAQVWDGSAAWLLDETGSNLALLTEVEDGRGGAEQGEAR